MGRSDAGPVELFPVRRDVVIGMRQRPRQSLCLQRHDLVARGALGIVQLGVVSAFLQLRRSHYAFPRIIYFCWVSAREVGSQPPPMVRECPRNSAITASSTMTRPS